jgi:hypothetical protein
MPRLSKNKKNEQFYKVALHELAIPKDYNIAKQDLVFMRDAKGGNPFNEEKMVQVSKLFEKENQFYLVVRDVFLPIATLPTMLCKKLL